MASEGMNLVILQGNLAQDAELRQAGQTPVLNIRMATNERYKSGDEWKERVDYHSVTLFGPRATGLAQYMVKGKSLLVEGRLQTRSFEDKQGNKQYRTDVVANKVILLGGGEGGQQQRRQAPTGGSGQTSNDESGGPGWGSDDIPFARFDIPT